MSLPKSDGTKVEKREHPALLLCYLPESLKRRLKMHCAENNVSMSRTVVRLIREFLEKYEAEKG